MSFYLVQIDSPKHTYLWNSVSQTPLHEFIRKVKENLIDQFDFLLILDEHKITENIDNFDGGIMRSISIEECKKEEYENFISLYFPNCSLTDKRSDKFIGGERGYFVLHKTNTDRIIENLDYGF